QLIEAGVDLDFPVVMRAMGPLPSLAQADGRCNRNGTHPSGLGQTIVFELVEGGCPSGAYYTHGTVLTKVMLAGSGQDFCTPEMIAGWYHRFLADPAVRQDSRNVQGARARFAFKTTAELFR